MKCCIQNCGNNGKLKKISQSSTSISERITFHLFPRDPKQRLSWLESLAIPNWVPTNRTVICSNHFKEEDFYFTKQGIRRIKYGVIPFIEDDCYGTAALRVCKLCLSLDCRMYRIQENGLDKMYQDIMGKEPTADTNNRLPMGICWECTARLQSAASFRSKALFSDSLLQEHLKNHANLKISDIVNIHRRHTNLKSSWSVQEVFKFNSHDAEAHAPNTFIKTEVIGIPHNEEVEIEVHNLVTDKIIIKDERKNEIIEETYTNADVKTEIDLIPITEIEIVGKEIDYDDATRVSAENIYVNDAKIDLDNVVLLKNEEDIESMKLSKDISDSDDHDDEQMDLCKDVDSDDDDQVAENDHVTNVCDDDDDRTYVTDEVIPNVANEAIVCEDKKTEVQKKKAAVKRKAKTDDVIIWVKGRPKKNKQPYVKPSIPIDENIFTITPLNHDELRREILDRRDSDRYKRAPFKCDVCFTGFPTKDKQERHVFKHSELSGSIKCTICHIRMKKTRQLRSHMKRLHTMEFTCKLCPMVTRNRALAVRANMLEVRSMYRCGQRHAISSILHISVLERPMDQLYKRAVNALHVQYNNAFKALMRLPSSDGNVALGHMKYHAGSKYECPQCFIEFEKQTTLLNHLRLKHMSAYVCELCGYTFVSKTGVDVHKRMKHKLFDKTTEFKGPNCDVCDVKFLTLKAYDRHLHLSSKHIKEDDPNRMSNDPSIKQRRLGRTWANAVRRPIIHRKDVNRAPVSNGTVTCEQCGVILESLRVYAAHFKHAHPGFNRTQFLAVTTPYMCEHCGKFFLNTTTLAGHMWVHTGQKRFQCDHCNKSFSMKANLAGHMRQHEPVRRMYDCSVCGKHFTFSYNLTRHMFVHTGLRPFKCDACEKTFRTSGELRSHVDYVHLKKPRPKRVRRNRKKCDLNSLEY